MSETQEFLGWQTAFKYGVAGLLMLGLAMGAYTYYIEQQAIRQHAQVMLADQLTATVSKTNAVNDAKKRLDTLRDKIAELFFTI